MVLVYQKTNLSGKSREGGLRRERNTPNNGKKTAFKNATWERLPDVVVSGKGARERGKETIAPLEMARVIRAAPREP